MAMNSFGWLVLVSCVPLVLGCFAVMPPRRAVIMSTVFTWLFMPNGGLAIKGLPDYTKMSATTFAIMLGILLFDAKRLLRFRLRWVDAPVLVWCLGQIATSVSNQLGSDGGWYDGFSQCLRSMLMWGFPYLIGRIYLTDFEGVRECAMGFVVGGLVYVPLCLWEVRTSPNLQLFFYGLDPYYELPRFGLGYRPIVFMVTGLEVGMWMAAATLCAYWLWVSGVERQIRGMPFGWAVAALLFTLILTKSVGATILGMVGLCVLEFVRRRKQTWIVLILVFTPVLYITVRGTGFWSGRELIDYTAAYMSDRLSSVETRIVSEDHLVERAKERLWLGWGGYNRSRVIDPSTGKDLYPTDGLWVITLGTQGLVGLVAMTLTFIQPLWLTYRRFPAKYWARPPVAPVAVLAILLGLYMVDNLANAMPNPLYAIAVGGVTGLSVVLDPLRERREMAAKHILEAEKLRGEGRMAEAALVYLDALEIFHSDPGDGDEPDPDALDEQAYAHEALAEISLADPLARAAEARRHMVSAVKAREAALTCRPESPDSMNRLAIGFENLGRLLGAQGLPRDAEWAWARALDLRERLAMSIPNESEFQKSLSDARNDLAWHLTTHRDARPDALADAIRLARGAVDLRPQEGAYWNTLGAASYYAGEYEAAIEALGHSVRLGDGGAGTGFDHYLLAMAYAHLGAKELARESFDRAHAWSSEHQPGHFELARLREEAANLIGA